MALTAESLVQGAKVRLSLPIEKEAFDAELQEFANDAIDRLYPAIQRELAEDETTTLAADTSQFTLPTGMIDIRSGGMYIKSSTDTTSEYQSYSDYSIHNGVVYLQEDFTTAKTVKLLGLGYPTMETVGQEFKMAVIFYMLSDFYALLAGSKSKYNIYIQASGARGVDNMRDTSDWYAIRAAQEVADRSMLQGA